MRLQASEEIPWSCAKWAGVQTQIYNVNSDVKNINLVWKRACGNICDFCNSEFKNINLIWKTAIFASLRRRDIADRLGNKKEGGGE